MGVDSSRSLKIKDNTLVNFKKDKMLIDYFNQFDKAQRQTYTKFCQKKNIDDYLNGIINSPDFDPEIIQVDTDLNWYDNIYYYIYYIQEDWAIKLLRWMDKEPFLYENKFQSISFYQQFQMESEPKCLLDRETYIELEFEKVTKDNIPRISVTNKLGGSISMHELVQEEMGGAKTNFIFRRGRTKEIIRLLKDHLNEKDHPITILINKFADYFADYLQRKKVLIVSNANAAESEYSRSVHAGGNIINSSEGGSRKGGYGGDYKEEADEASHDYKIATQIKNFVKVVEISLKLFYSSTIDIDEFSCEKGDLMNLVYWYLFQNEHFYKQLYSVYKSLYKPEIKKLKAKFEIIGDINPQDIGIKPKYCLNNYTKEKYNIKIEENNFKLNQGPPTIPLNPTMNKTLNVNNMRVSIENDEFIQDKSKDYENGNADENDSSRLVFLSNIFQENFSLKKDTNNLDLSIHDIPFDLAEAPYNLAVTLLRRMEYLNSPIEKLILITDLRKKILESINEFWSEYQDIVDKEKDFLKIESDELMLIITYIIIKAKKQDILVQTQIIKDFTAAETKKTMFGYYSSYIDAAICSIMDCDDLKKMRNVLANQ